MQAVATRIVGPIHGSVGGPGLCFCMKRKGVMSYSFFLSSARAAAMFHGPNGHCLRSLRSYMQMNRIMPPRMTKVSLPVPARVPQHIRGGVTEHAAERCSIMVLERLV